MGVLAGCSTLEDVQAVAGQGESQPGTDWETFAYEGKRDILGDRDQDVRIIEELATPPTPAEDSYEELPGYLEATDFGTESIIGLQLRPSRRPYDFEVTAVAEQQDGTLRIDGTRTGDADE